MFSNQYKVAEASYYKAYYETLLANSGDNASAYEAGQKAYDISKHFLSTKKKQSQISKYWGA